MIAGKTLIDNTNLFFPNDYQDNEKIIYKYFKDKYGKRKSKPSFRFKKVDETRNCILEVIKHNGLMNQKHKKVCSVLNYSEHFLVFVSAVSGCVSISVFVSLIGVPLGTVISAPGLKTYKSIIKKKRKKHDKIVLTEKN